MKDVTNNNKSGLWIEGISKNHIIRCRQFNDLGYQNKKAKQG
jgi:hypothetical protein